MEPLSGASSANSSPYHSPEQRKVALEPKDRTPKRVRQILADLIEGEMPTEYELVPSHRKRWRRALEDLSHVGTPKRMELHDRIAEVVTHRVLDPKGPRGPWSSPGSHRKAAAVLRDSPWLGQQMSALFKDGSAGAKASPLCPPLNVEHITKFESGKGFHLCNPSHPLWMQLEGRVFNAVSSIFVGHLPGDKYSTFWPQETTEGELVVMCMQAKVIARGDRLTELVITHDPRTKEAIYALRYFENFVYTSFFPLFYCERFNPEVASHTIMTKDDTGQLTVSIEVPSKEIHSYALSIMRPINPEKMVVDDCFNKVVCLDVTEFFHAYGLPKEVEKGAVIMFRYEEVGYDRKPLHRQLVVDDYEKGDGSDDETSAAGVTNFGDLDIQFSEE